MLWIGQQFVSIFSLLSRKHGLEAPVILKMISPTEIPAAKGKRRDPPDMKKVWIRFALCMLLMVAGTFGAYWYATLQTYHLAAVQLGVLYRDGNHDLREFKHALAFTHAKTVVSLIDD